LTFVLMKLVVLGGYALGASAPHSEQARRELCNIVHSDALPAIVAVADVSTSLDILWQIGLPALAMPLRREPGL
jgi:hypothetical protein